MALETETQTGEFAIGFCSSGIPSLDIFKELENKAWKELRKHSQNPIHFLIDRVSFEYYLVWFTRKDGT